MTNKRLTILFVPMNLLGHLNPMIGFAQNFVPKHRVVFAVSQKSKGQLEQYGFEEEEYQVEHFIFNMDKSKMKDYIDQHKMLDNQSPVDHWKKIAEEEIFLKIIKMTNSEIKHVVDRVKPDLVVVDVAFIVPSAIKNNVWINIISPNPNTVLFDERAPPPGCGLPANDPNSWKKYQEELKLILTPMIQGMNDYYESEGLPRSKQLQWCYHSPYLNIYHYPLELDYTDLRPNPPNWVRMDTFMIKSNEKFVIPEKLKNLSGKLIYFSLGSVSSINIELMKRLIDILSFSPDRFIISKGMLGDEYDLPLNFWGGNYLPQTAILKVVDLAIIHGGNNSLCEAFYFGKPIIVMPVFADQHDNAQRVHEKGFGIQINPFTCTKDQLLNAIEQLLNDKNLNNKLKLIAERSEREAKANKIVEIVEQVVSKSKINSNK